MMYCNYCQYILHRY